MTMEIYEIRNMVKKRFFSTRQKKQIWEFPERQRKIAFLKTHDSNMESDKMWQNFTQFMKL